MNPKKKKGTNKMEDSPQIILTNDKIKQLACGGYHSLILVNDGTIYSFGWNNMGKKKKIFLFFFYFFLF